MISSLEKKIGFAFGLALISLSMLSFLQYRMTRRLIEDNQWVAHTQEVLRELARTRNRLNGADAFAGSFIVTGNPSDLLSYEQAVAAVRAHLQSVQKLTADNALEQQRLQDIEAPVNDSIGLLQEEVGSRKTADQPPPEKLLTLEDAIRQTSNNVRNRIGDMESAEASLLTQRREVAERSNHQTSFLVLFGSLASILFLSAAGIVLYFDMIERQKTGKILRESEERFRLLVSGVRDYVILMLDPEGHVSSWNSGGERITGYQPTEIMGKHVSCFYPEADVQSGKVQRELQAAVKDGQFEEEGWRMRKDGSRFWADVTTNALKDDEGRLYGYAQITRDVTDRMKAREVLQAEVSERRQAQLKLHDSEQSLRQLSVHLFRTQDEERRRIGRELHDSVGQNLAALKMGLSSLESIVGSTGNGAGQQFVECMGLAEECLREVRTISYLLHPPLLEELGLTSAISWYLDGFSKRSGIETTIEISPNLRRLPSEVELAIFRILQEGLTNVHRHSGSATAHVRMLMKDGMFTLEVHDHGKGMPSSNPSWQDVTNTLGVGLRSMKERMIQLGGHLEVCSTNQGTIVRATVPSTEVAQELYH